MPLTTKRIGNRHRLVEEKTGKIAKNTSGKAIDGGGHRSKDAALKQIQAINISKHKK